MASQQPFFAGDGSNLPSTPSSSVASIRGFIFAVSLKVGTNSTRRRTAWSLPFLVSVAMNVILGRACSLADDSRTTKFIGPPTEPTAPVAQTSTFHPLLLIWRQLCFTITSGSSSEFTNFGLPQETPSPATAIRTAVIARNAHQFTVVNKGCLLSSGHHPDS